MRKSLLLLLILPLLLTGCLYSLEKEGITNTTIYKGRIIDKDNKPLNGIMVRVTNGTLIHNSSTSNVEGIFEVAVDITKIDSKYYIQLGDTSSFHKRSSLKGFGLDVYDYGDIPFIDIKLPIVETLGVTNMTERSFTCKCNVKSQGEAIVTERGLCWSTNIPTINDNKEKFGSGEGEYLVTVSNESLNFHTTTYYARAYAVNEYGVAYGDALELNSSRLKEFSLPTMQFGGYTYTIHPDLGSMTWEQANTACENLVAYGQNDWFLPNKEEMWSIYKETNLIQSGCTYWTSTKGRYGYWYLKPSGSSWVLDDYNGETDHMYHVIPVRKNR